MKISDINSCVLIPTYNNQKTLERVINGVLEYSSGNDVIVVNDGSTDQTLEILKSYGDKIILVSYEKNKGKGNALKQGFRKAIELGFENTITIDSDGQHYPSDIPVFIKAAKENPGALLMGSRNMEQDGVPQKSSFGNKFSNFWYKLETGIELPDTQTGYRLYPLGPLSKIKLYTWKFETEIEVIVKLAWKGVNVLPVDVQVLYDPNERVTHFRPFQDFTRISVLNTYLVILTLLWYLPKRIVLASFKKEFWIKLKYNILLPEESSLKKAAAIGFGFFMGIFPVWGFQMLIGIAVAAYFRLNKAIFLAAANISLPPIIPFIIYGSYLSGGLVMSSGELPNIEDLTLADIHGLGLQYTVGAVIFATLAGLVGFLVTFPIMYLIRRK